MESVSAPAASPLETRIKAHAHELGFDDVGVTRLAPSEHAEFYRAWIAAGRHGTMAYLAREDAVARRLLGPEAWPLLKSAVVLTHGYIADPSALASAPAGHAEIARYARGRDYHKVLKQKLLRLLARIEGDVGRPLPLARAYVDTGPVLERELAQRSGLGWFGRSSMLLHPRRGSYFFLSSLLLELELDADAPFEADHCGTCHACVSACPTGALLGRNTDGAPLVDATRCISYLTIEHRGPIPRELRSLMGNRVFGCDICQEVCPWNGGKFVTLTREVDFDGRERERKRKRRREQQEQHEQQEQRELPGTTLPSLISLMAMTYEAWDEWTQGSAIRRAGYAGLRRNVAVALGNWGSGEAVPVLVEALSDPEPLVRGHAGWALGEIPLPSASAALAERLAVEDDSWVRVELELVLARFRDKSSRLGRSGADLSVM